MFRKLFFRLYLFFNGIRFYQTDALPQSKQFKTAVFETVANHIVEFHFYREECEDLIYRFGQIRSERFIGYVIQAKLDKDLPEILYRYNNLKFFFSGRDWLIRDDDEICGILLNVYLDFINDELKSNQR